MVLAPSQVDLARVVGPPGCGKTTYITRQVRRAWEAGKEVLLCSLTRTAAAEMAGRDMPLPREAIGTLHSHAYRALRGGFTDIADTPKMLAEWNRQAPSYWHISGADRDLDEDNAAPTDSLGKGDATYMDYQCNRARMIPQDRWLRSGTREFAQAWESWKVDGGLVDFTDLLEIALQDVDAAPGDPDVIFADEAQDFSALEMALLQKWGAEAGQVVVVGDPWQALYEWRGADADVFYQGEATERVLSQSYRVPMAVHTAAMTWMQRMPGYTPIEYAPTEQEGECRQLTATWGTPADALPTIVSHLEAGQTVMYLASCSYMLGPILKLLRTEGIPFHNRYRLKHGGWNPLQTRRGSVGSAQRLAGFLRMGEEGEWGREDLRAWLSGAKCSEFLPTGEGWQKFEKRLNQVDVDPLPYGLSQTLIGEEAIEASMTADTGWYIQHLQAPRREPASFPCAIARRYGREGLLQEPSLTVGTIHSVKGGEADVVILSPDLSIKGMESWNVGPEGRASVHRLMYVGMTRARQALYVMQPAQPRLAVKVL